MKRSSCVFIVCYPNVFPEKLNSFLSSNLLRLHPSSLSLTLLPSSLRKLSQAEETSAVYHHSLYPQPAPQSNMLLCFSGWNHLHKDQPLHLYTTFCPWAPSMRELHIIITTQGDALNEVSCKPLQIKS